MLSCISQNEALFSGLIFKGTTAYLPPAAHARVSCPAGLQECKGLGHLPCNYASAHYQHFCSLTTMFLFYKENKCVWELVFFFGAGESNPGLVHAKHLLPLSYIPNPCISFFVAAITQFQVFTEV